MMNACVVRPLLPANPGWPWMSGDPVLPLVPGGVPHHPGWGLPNPWTDGYDPELERLRRLEREASREREKEAIRERLRRMGVPEDRIGGRPAGLPVGPLPGRRAPGLPSLDDIIKTAAGSRR